MSLSATIWRQTYTIAEQISITFYYFQLFESSFIAKTFSWLFITFGKSAKNSTYCLKFRCANQCEAWLLKMLRDIRYLLVFVLTLRWTKKEKQPSAPPSVELDIVDRSLQTSTRPASPANTHFEIFPSFLWFILCHQQPARPSLRSL